MKLIKKTFSQGRGVLELELIQSGEHPAVLLECDGWHFDSLADIKRLAAEIEAMLPQERELS